VRQSFGIDWVGLVGSQISLEICLGYRKVTLCDSQVNHFCVMVSYLAPLVCLKDL